MKLGYFLTDNDGGTTMSPAKTITSNSPSGSMMESVSSDGDGSWGYSDSSGGSNNDPSVTSMTPSETSSGPVVPVAPSVPLVVPGVVSPSTVSEVPGVVPGSTVSITSPVPGVVSPTSPTAMVPVVAPTSPETPTVPGVVPDATMAPVTGGGNGYCGGRGDDGAKDELD